MPWTLSSVRCPSSPSNPRTACAFGSRLADPPLSLTVSTILAGMRRSTGLTKMREEVEADRGGCSTGSSVKSERITGENTEMNKWVSKYLGVGEWVLDHLTAISPDRITVSMTWNFPSPGPLGIERTERIHLDEWMDTKIMTHHGLLGGS
ncbi:hypothetical protein F5Y14DRAFT_454461 [Nemania sp. NC0429]|nr:hypothetical protein F5Y14DRAFT_454461 [Nemania sp. NC0429]